MTFEMKINKNITDFVNFKIVVARYNENIEWLYEKFNNLVVYNKFYPLNIRNEIMVPNFGRESETYLRYIITNYNNLPDVVVFTQARISDHRGYNDINYLLKLCEQALLFGKSIPDIKHTENKYQKSCWDRDWNVESNKYYYLQQNYLNNEPIVFEKWFNQHIGCEYKTPFHIYSNGIFAIRKDLILRNPIEYYQKLISLVNHHVNPAEGHFFERSWFYIFK